MALIYTCPADKQFLCSWEGYASEMKNHFEKNHYDLFYTTNTIDIDINNNNDENRLLIYLQKEIYLVRSGIKNGIVWLKLHYLGSALLASQKHYNIFISPPINACNGYGNNNKLSRQPSMNANPDENDDVLDNVESSNNTNNNTASPLMFESCISRTNEGWEIDLDKVEKLHGAKIDKITCSIQIEEYLNGVNIIRHHSSIKQKKHSFIDNNHMRETFPVNDEDIIKDLEYLDRKLSQLKLRSSSFRHKSDIFDNISQLHYDVLENPFLTSNSKQTSLDEDCTANGELSVLYDLPADIDLTCASCSTTMIPPIYLCNNGHNVCGLCRLKACNLCKGFITSYRNQKLEKISQNYKHPCRYVKQGCMERLFYSSVSAHETECPYRTFKCQIMQCNFTGSFEKLCAHIHNIHFSCKISETAVNPFPKDCEFYIAQKKMGIFYCKSEQKGNTILWQVTYCGPVEKTFFCELMFKGSKMRQANILSRHDNVYSFQKSLEDLKKVKAKEKYAILTISM